MTETLVNEGVEHRVDEESAQQAEAAPQLGDCRPYTSVSTNQYPAVSESSRCFH